MKYAFTGFNNWPPSCGELTLEQGFDVFRASDVGTLPRDMCESCICWREHGTCHLVQVEDYESDREEKAKIAHLYDGITECVCYRNCCPILFFDFLGIKLPKLEKAAE